MNAAKPLLSALSSHPYFCSRINVSHLFDSSYELKTVPIVIAVLFINTITVNHLLNSDIDAKNVIIIQLNLPHYQGRR